jgi:hypothetical protein
MADHGSLKGSVFKRKMMNPNRLKGLGAFVASFYGLMGIKASTCVLTPFFGPTIPLAACGIGFLYGMN